MSPNLPNEKHYFELAISKKKNWESGGLDEAVKFISERPGEITKLLEVGCGMAEPVISRLPSHLAYTGIDPSQYCIDHLLKNFPNQTFKLGFAEKLPFDKSSFDAVLSNATVQMLAHPKASLDEMIRVVRPGGYLVVLCPNFELPWSELRAVAHYKVIKKAIFSLQRYLDLAKRMMGKLTFRTVPQNYVEATGAFKTYKNEDAKYVTSGYEIATYFRRNGFKEIFSQTPKKTNFIKTLATKLPVLRYAGTGIFLIYRKNNSLA